MNAKRAALLAMARMALVDGSVSEEEREMLGPLLGPGESVDQLLDDAKGVPMAELVKRLDRYADRFFVALRVATMASIDEHLDAREEALYAELVEALGIRPDDRALIEESVRSLGGADGPSDSEEMRPSHPRIAQLFHASSFA